MFCVIQQNSFRCATGLIRTAAATYHTPPVSYKAMNWCSCQWAHVLVVVTMLLQRSIQRGDDSLTTQQSRREKGCLLSACSVPQYYTNVVLEADVMMMTNRASPLWVTALLFEFAAADVALLARAKVSQQRHAVLSATTHFSAPKCTKFGK